MTTDYLQKAMTAAKAERDADLKRLSQFDTFHVTVTKVIWRNAEGSFFIAAVSSKKPQGDFCVKTTYPLISEGGIYDMQGSWSDDRKHGLQFTATNVSLATPDTEYGMTRYLADNIDGLGPRSAALVVKAFGKETKNVLDNTPDRLYSVAGLRRKSVPKIIRSWNSRKGMNALYVYLTSIRVDAGNARRIYDKFGGKSIELIKQNPYCLTEVEGIGFTTADNVAKELGIKTDNPFRLRAGLRYALEETAQSEGHVYLTRKELVESASKLLTISEASKIEAEVDYLTGNKRIVQDGDAIYSPRLHDAEVQTAELLASLMAEPVHETAVSDKLGKADGVSYDEVQMDAIRTAMKSKVMVLTGGPGTGKTTTTKGIIAAWKEAGLKIRLAAPTGRAAKRLSEATGMEASTIHRLLEFQGDRFGRNHAMPLDGDALVVDESSMIDIELMRSLMDALPKNMRLVLVGDVDQLPSVGAGNVLRDIIESGAVPTVRLTRIFRQAQGSRIITNAHLIDEGKPIVYDNSAGSDFFFFADTDNDKVTADVLSLVTDRLPRYYGVEPRDIQVLSPMKRSGNGVLALNKALQDTINPSGEELHCCPQKFRTGDKIMQMKNDYDNDVFNGDMGTVVAVDNDEGTLTVDFGRSAPVEYDKSSWGNLSLAYACTIHKSQGSEYPIVVMPFTMQFYIMLQRNLLYTGVTRAKKVCVLVGDKKAVSAAIRNGKTARRNTKLRERLRELLNTKDNENN